MLKIGQPSPDFEFPDQHERSFRLKDNKGRKNIVLFFFESSSAPVCVKELQAFMDHQAEFDALDTSIVGVSQDDVISSNKITSRLNIKYSLFADSTNTMRKLFEVQPRFGFLPGRMTFVIDKNGIIRNIISSVFESDVHIEESLKSIRELETEMGRY